MVTFDFRVIRLVEHEIQTAPPGQEAGGLLFGCGAQVKGAAGLPNSAPDPCQAFEIDPDGMAVFVGRFAALEMVGTFHSHPNGRADMSSADAAMARATGLALIVGAQEMAAWEWRLWDPSAGGEVEFTIAPPHVLG